MTHGKYLLSTTAAAALAANFAVAQDETSSVFGSVVETPDIVLTERDGPASQAGQLLDFEDGFFTLLTEESGVIRVSADTVTCEGEACPEGTTPVVLTPAEVKAAASVRVTGSDTVGLQLMPPVLEDYAVFLDADAEIETLSETDTHIRYLQADGSEITNIFVDSAGTAEGLVALGDGTTDFSMATRTPQAAEAERIVGGGQLQGSDNETVIALDSIAAVVHPSNPVDGLELAQIGAIYAGEITNWSEVGGPDAPITVIARDADSSTRSIFENAIYSGEGRNLGEAAVEIDGDDAAMAASVRDDPNAIGYVSQISTDGLKSLSLTSSCGITSTATEFDIKTEQYPLVRRMYLYNGVGGLSEDQQQFLDYALSPAVDDAIKRAGFVNFSVSRTTQELTEVDVDVDFDRDPTPEDTRLINQLTDDKALWDRLSTTVRFPTGTSVLGRKELNDINRLISHLEDLPEGTRIVIAGFADDVGNFDTNITLSERRAVSVASQIADLAGPRLDNITFETRAYGELAPLVCNTDENARAINRRVEVWVRK